MTSFRSNLPSLKAMVLEDIPGCASFLRFGRNTDVDAASAAEDVWNGGGLYTGHPNITLNQAETVTVVSSSTNDASAGTGMRSIRLEGIGSSGSYQTEDLSMNGTNAVTSTKTWYRVFRGVGLTAGSGGVNAGTITCRHSTTTANIFFVMPLGIGRTYAAVFTVPSGMMGLISRTRYSVSNAQLSAQEATVSVGARLFGTGMWTFNATQHVSTVNAVEARADGGIKVPSLTDVVVRVLSATADNLDITAAFEIFLVPNS